MVKENKLHTAVKSNNLPNVLKVLEKYAKQNSRSSSTKPKKLDLDSRDNLGLTVAHHAARNGYLDILETILNYGCKYEVFDLHGLRPISYACALGHMKVVEYLLRYGSCANRINTIEYLTPLHLAAMYGYAEIVHLLLHCKADPFALNRENKTPLDLACAYGKYNDILALYDELWIDVCSQDLDYHLVTSEIEGMPVINLLFSYTSSLVNKPKPMNNNMNDAFGSRTPHSDQISRYNRFNQSNVPTTPKVERNLSYRSSSPYGSLNTSSSGNSSNYSSENCKSRMIHNISFGESSGTNSPISQNIMRYPAQNMMHSNAPQVVNDKSEIPSQLLSSSDSCCCPVLYGLTGSDSSNDLRQNLREACFAVQAKAILPFQSEKEGQKGISFEVGDLITVLKQYHNGVVKGFVTSEGISNTSAFPIDYIDYINDHKPPTCCNRPVERHFLQSPEKTPIASRGKSVKERPCFLELQASNQSKGNSNNNESEIADQDNGSPILIPPQMSDIRTNTTNSTVKYCNSALPRCSCDSHLSHMCNSNKRIVTNQSPDSPSVSTSDLSYCLQLGPGFISTVNNSTNKRNSIASMDSGRGSATDSKSVVSGSTPASTSCSKAPTSPVYFCPAKTNSQPINTQCRCRECNILPPTMPAPFHQSNEDNFSRQNCYQNILTADNEFGMPRTMSYSQQVSIDSLYYPCSMISLDDTQYSTTGSDRGIDDVMVSWLSFVGLGSYSDVLTNNGYDLATLTKATPEDLNASGVTNPKDRQLMKTHLSRLSVCDGLPDIMPVSIHDLLDSLKLLQYEELLNKQNFTKIEHLVGLTWEDLADIGVEKLGHQKKLSLAIERLSRLASGTTNFRNQISPPSLEMIRGSPQKYSTVTQSRSFEELPYPTAVMTEIDAKEKFHKNCYQSLRSSANMSASNSVKPSLLSKSDESVSSVTEMQLPRSHIVMYGRHDNHSVSSSASSCSQESSKDDSYSSQTQHTSSAAHFAHDNVGTVRIKRPALSTQVDCEDASCMLEINAIINNLSQQLSQVS